MAKIWLKIWLEVKENGTKKIILAKMVAKKKIPSANPADRALFVQSYKNEGTKCHVMYLVSIHVTKYNAIS